MPVEASVCFKQSSLDNVRKLQKLSEAADSAVREEVSDVVSDLTSTLFEAKLGLY